MDPQEHLEKFKTVVVESEGRVAASLHKRDDEIKANREASDATGKALDAQVAAWDSAKAEMAEMKAELDKSSGHAEAVVELKAALDEAKAEGAKASDLIAELQEHVKSSQRPGFGAGDGEELKSIGERYLASDQFKATQANNGKSSPMFDTGCSLLAPREQKAIFVSTAAERLIEPFRREFVEPQLRQLHIRSLFDVNTTDKDTIEYVQETGFAASGAATGTQTHGAATFIAETGAVPEAQLEMELKTEPIKDVAHFVTTSKNVLDDLPRLRNYIDKRLLFGLEFKEDFELLYGSGAGASLQGITTEAGVQPYAWSDGEAPTAATADTKFDAVRRSMTLAQVAEYVPDGVILNPEDWEDIELVKASDGHYLLAPVPTNPGEGMAERVWRVPVIVTNTILSGTWLTGSFRMGAELWDRTSGTITVSADHEDYFTRRLVAIMAEQREACVVLRPESFVSGTFDAAPTVPV